MKKMKNVVVIVVLVVVAMVAYMWLSVPRFNIGKSWGVFRQEASCIAEVHKNNL